MEITEVRIKLMDSSEDRLRAFCSVTFDDCFVIRDLKIIEGNNGPFVAMPSRKLTTHCRNCNCKNHLRSRYCNQCGKRISGDHIDTDTPGRVKLYADIAHPINAECREQIQNRVISEFNDEIDRARQPGYVSRYDDDYDEAPRGRGSRSCQVESGSIKSDSGEFLQGPHSPAASPGDATPAGKPDQGSHEGPESEQPHGSPARGSDFGNGIF